MSRPIIWALGTLAAAAIGATWSGGRIAARFDPGSVQAKPALTSGQAEPGQPREQSLTVHADLRGHYTVHPALGSQRLRMLVDTGASLIALTHEDARTIGLRADPSRVKRISTANGTLEVGSVRIPEIRIGDILMRDVDAVVMPPGRLDTSLLGMSFLKRLRGFEVSEGRLLLKG